ncbi:hypothetical protein AMK68_00180 [candidate division KD3-62 bacterium DG_56]|uniref:Uncharacterized protein n=1 Tax=candidate division KD3-62 bacterium DG_56 TaxID=1704032 RepID=A0A0S7XQV5_9BACT|nr:MAG: hypothetical protein AMK68_00180 [candidate division KD3-62 bacterium DG_56]
MKGLDISFAQPPPEWWATRFQAGYRVAVQDVWTGGYAGNDGLKAVAARNLRNARTAGFKIAAYANASPPNWWPLATQVAEIKANAGSEWANIGLVAVDVEIPGITMARVMELANALEREGKRADVLYTARWFWAGHMGGSTDARWKRFKLWNADYDGDATLDFPAPYGPWMLVDLVGKQYAGTTNLGSPAHAVDLNEFDEAFLKEDIMAKLDDDDKLYLAGLMRGVVRAIATGQFSSGLRQGDPDYTEAERDLKDVMDKLAAIDRAGTGTGGLSEPQVEAIVQRVLKRQKLIVD